MKINQQQIDSLLALPAQKRYEHFVKVIVDWEMVWGLYKDGWALATTDEGISVFPVWPAKEYASLCATNDWTGYEPRSFSLEEFIEELLPNLKQDNVRVGVFPTPNNIGATPDIEQLLADLTTEQANYE